MKKKKVPMLACAMAMVMLLSACGSGEKAGSAKDTVQVTEGSGSIEETTPSDDTQTGGKDAQEETAGILSSFACTDLEGNPVDQSILEEYDITMVNVWATFCGPCLREMPDLGELASEYEEKGVRIVGLLSDVLDSEGNISEEQVDTAREIVESTGADYLHLLPSQDLYGLLAQIYAVPTTFFVDKEGRQVGKTYVKSMTKEKWIEVIEDTLKEVSQ